MGLCDRRRARRWASTQYGIALDNSDEPRLNASQALALLNGSTPTATGPELTAPSG